MHQRLIGTVGYRRMVEWDNRILEHGRVGQSDTGEQYGGAVGYRRLVEWDSPI